MRAVEEVWIVGGPQILARGFVARGFVARGRPAACRRTRCAALPIGWSADAIDIGIKAGIEAGVKFVRA